MRCLLCLLLVASVATSQEKPTEFTNIRLFEAFVRIYEDACDEAEEANNELLIKKARADAITQLTKIFKGKTVSWKVEVARIEDGVVFLDGRLDVSAELHNTLSPPDQNIRVLVFELPIGKGVTAKRAESLKAGEKVTINAKVREIVFVGGKMDKFPLAVGLESLTIP